MLRTTVERWLARVKGLPSGWLIGGASVLVVVVIVASVGMFRTYNYIQHDNEFCNSCHLMADPFQRFEQSAHRGLGCKACHRPNMVQRTKMALTQVFEMPDSISQHADVPREICAECHVNGNPEEWKQVANSVGHRLHLESKNPGLKEIQCVDCHGAGIHEFAVADQTCGQSGCHENVSVKLGKMSNLTIHCVSCHDFNKPVTQAVTGKGLNAEITPRANDCLSCHAMRDRLDRFPADEPHQAVCGTCHNPHEQRTTADAVRSCTAGCHERVESASPMHQRLGAGVLQNCTACHTAHTWKADGDACASCHSPESLDGGTAPRIKRIESHPGRMSVFDAVLLPARLSIGLVAQITSAAGPFKHAVHKNVACKSCHESRDGHGSIKVATVAACSSCHHAAANQRRCTSCHQKNELAKSIPRRVDWRPSVESSTTFKTLSFEHAKHTRMDCGSCHKDVSALRKVPACQSCHESHHTDQSSCSFCHTDVKSIRQHTRGAHLTCSGSGCHQNTVTTTLRTQRAVCLACHTGQTDHEPAGDCASCHMIRK